MQKSKQEVAAWLYFFRSLSEILLSQVQVGSTLRQFFIFLDEVQNFTLQPNTCLNATAIESFPLASLQDCADNCASMIWCRSFNYYPNTTICYLFSWYNPTGPGFIVNNIGGCIRYTYTPQKQKYVTVSFFENMEQQTFAIQHVCYTHIFCMVLRVKYATVTIL